MSKNNKRSAANLAATTNVNSNTITNSIANENEASATATTNVLIMLTKREERIANNLSNATQRNAKAAQLLKQRALTNMLIAAKQKKELKAINTIANVKTAKYESIYAGVTNMHMLSALLLKNKANEAEIAVTFINAYALKNVHDLKFIAQRATIYMAHSKTLNILKSL